VSYIRCAAWGWTVSNVLSAVGYRSTSASSTRVESLLFVVITTKLRKCQLCWSPLRNSHIILIVNLHFANTHSETPPSQRPSFCFVARSHRPQPAVLPSFWSPAAARTCPWTPIDRACSLSDSMACPHFVFPPQCTQHLRPGRRAAAALLDPALCAVAVTQQAASTPGSSLFMTLFFMWLIAMTSVQLMFLGQSVLLRPVVHHATNTVFDADLFRRTFSKSPRRTSKRG